MSNDFHPHHPKYVPNTDPVYHDTPTPPTNSSYSLALASLTIEPDKDLVFQPVRTTFLRSTQSSNLSFRPHSLVPILRSFRQGRFPMPVLVGSSPTATSTNSPYQLGRPSSSHSPTSPHLIPRRRRSLDSVSVLRLDASADDPQSGFDGLADEEDPEWVKVDGVRHVELELDPTQYQTEVFARKVLKMLQSLRIPHWSSIHLSAQNLKIHKVTGSMTNAVFFVSFQPNPGSTYFSRQPTLSSDPSLTGSSSPSTAGIGLLSLSESPAPMTDTPLDKSEAPTLLLRVYGSASSTFISRPRELRVLHLLSSVYDLGPALRGTFTNGRIEEFFQSRALTASELRDPKISGWIGRRMAELHSADLDLLSPVQPGERREPEMLTSLREWITPARILMADLAHAQSIGALAGTNLNNFVEAFALDTFELEIRKYLEWLAKWERGEIGQMGRPWRMVFAHNDTQYGNLLLLSNPPPPPQPAHTALIVVDFEYAAPNPLTHDIANHFCEWRANYHHSTLPHSLSAHSPYPTKAERWNFYKSYLAVARGREVKDEQELEELDMGVKAWSPGGSATWALWGIVSAKAQVDALKSMDPSFIPDFEYLLYASERVQMFRQEIKDLGII
ncbi:Choline kinase [Phaffia rhodozyma]|uniref:Choline kinase n=1 Tax=Phaffia rhodozyma TaxID=264483 RepID=A0A0F7SWL4_PHARH|nr:Choline kinase [Phaffia rhodozyma]